MLLCQSATNAFLYALSRRLVYIGGDSNAKLRIFLKHSKKKFAILNFSATLSSCGENGALLYHQERKVMFCNGYKINVLSIEIVFSGRLIAK